MTEPVDPVTRILIGAGSFADAAAALKIMRHLRFDARTRIGGLFVEESEVIALCQVPNQRIVSASGMLVLAPTMSQVRTLIHADAKAFRSSLAQIAETVGLHWTFEQSTGDLVQQSLRASAGWDIIVFGHRNIHPVGGKIILLETQGASSAALTRFADQLADSVSADKIVFSIVKGHGSARDRHQFDTIEDAMAALARTNVKAVLVDLAHGPLRDADQLRQLLDVARAPVFAFGATMPGTEIEHSTQIPPVPGSESDPNVS